MREWYNEQYFQRMGRRATYKPRLFSISKIIRKDNPKTILDVGCGHGFLVKRCRAKGIEAWGVDFSDFAGSEIPDYFKKTPATELPFPDNYFDVVVSTDVLEHIYENELDKVYSEMKRVLKQNGKIFAVVAEKVEKSHVFNTHVTVHPLSWWKEKFPDIVFLEVGSKKKETPHEGHSS